MKKLLLIIIVFFTCLIFPTLAQAQLTKIRGKIIDQVTEKPVPFANIFFKNTTIGVSAGFEGQFSMEVDTPKDTLVASAMGYHESFIVIKKASFQEVVFRLEPDEVNLNEVEVFANADPGLIIFHKMIENKPKNNPEDFNYINYRLYNKIEIDANNVNDRFQKSKLMKKFQIAFQYVDTSAINGKAYLPVFISETVSQVYKRAHPKSTREIIEASQLSGFNSESLGQYMGGLYQDVNIYDNFIPIFEKYFISPLSSNGLLSYDYVVLDTLLINNKNCFHLMFKPRRKQELTFVGELWIHDSTFAVIKAEMKSAVDANINFVNDIAIGLEYDFVNHKHWVLSQDKIVLDVNVIENSMQVPGFFIRRNSHYSQFVFNHAPPDSVFSYPSGVKLLQGMQNKDTVYWKKNRDVQLNKNEKGVYTMVDSVQNIPLFKTYVDAIYLFTGGYLNWGKFELGPVFKTLSYNTTEGLRMRLGGRTNKNFSTKLRLHGYVAYGKKDQQLKGAGGMFYLLKKNPYRKIGFDFKYDLEQLGQRNVKFTDDNFLTSILRRSPNNKQSLVEGYKIYYSHDWFSGFNTTFTFNQRKMYPAGDLQFKIWNGTAYEIVNAIKTSEISLKIRFAFHEKYFVGSFERMRLGTSYPVLEVDATYGVPGLFASNQKYFRLISQIHQYFQIGSLGWSKYIVEAGKLWGTVPYPLLEIAPGNQTLIGQQYAYNLMNYYEFINDEYISLFYTHHFDGLLFNHIPFLRKLNWREVIHAKGIIGNISENNAQYSIFPAYSYSLSKPYYEVGAGIENILKVGRIDFIWRLNHHDHPQTQRFGIFISLQFLL
jgi:hypothetical protein